MINTVARKVLGRNRYLLLFAQFRKELSVAEKV